MAEKPSSPYVASGTRIAELTIKAVLLGSLLGILLTMANVYLGLYAGMTVSASIPAAVISMGILRGLMRTGTILENNIVQTIASAGESLAAGIIFTIPALVIAGVWTDFNYWQVTFIALLGGMLGVLFMIPLRRVLIVEEEELKYPEGVACAEVLITGEQGSGNIGLVFWALLIGAILKYLTGSLRLLAGSLEGAYRFGQSRLAMGVGCDISPALVAVGYIVGLNVAVLIFLGGAIAWLLGIPLYHLAAGLPEAESTIEAMNATWSAQIRYMGVGTMVVGGIWSILGVRTGIAKGLSTALGRYRSANTAGENDRTDSDLPHKAILWLLLPTVLLVGLLFTVLIDSASLGLISAAIMVVAAFFFVAVSSYIVGLVGSSNNPVSGMTISTVLLTSLLLLAFGLTGTEGIIATLGVAGVVCCAACTAGDVSQDLKTGHLLGATPYKQQWAQVIGVVTSAFVIAPILTLLHATSGIGMEVTEGVEYLRAPQANLFANIVQAMFGDDTTLPWTMVGIGAGIGVAVIVLDEYLRRSGRTFRTYVMPLAVGIYLPWALSVPILLGGLAAAVTQRIGVRSGRRDAVQRGVLLASGLIAGEALMGIVNALLVFTGVSLPTVSLNSPGKEWLSAAALAAILVTLVIVALGRREKNG